MSTPTGQAKALTKSASPVPASQYRPAEIISAAAAGIPSEAHAKDVEQFFKTHPTPSATQKIDQTLERIRILARFRAQNAGALAAYFNPNS